MLKIAVQDLFPYVSQITGRYEPTIISGSTPHKILNPIGIGEYIPCENCYFECEPSDPIYDLIQAAMYAYMDKDYFLYGSIHIPIHAFKFTVTLNSVILEMISYDVN